LTPDEIRAAAETHRELGPDYQSAVIESFLDKVGREIDARVDERMALARQMQIKPARGRSPMALAIVSMSLGIPLSAIALGVASSSIGGLTALVVIWIAITAINLAYTLGDRRPPPRPPFGHR
jgi:hypothetical protein